MPGSSSEANLTHEQLNGIDLYVPPDREKPGELAPGSHSRPCPEATAREQMRQKLKTAQGRATYKMRKAIVEPVFGHIKQVRGFRRFLVSRPGHPPTSGN